jgi:CHASE2 domain-containing sensor protein
VEPEDFLPLAGIILILGLGLVGVRATWRSRPLPVLAVGFAFAVIAFLGSWTIGLIFVPPAFLLLLAALALALSGKELTDRVKVHAQ